MLVTPTPVQGKEWIWITVAPRHLPDRAIKIAITRTRPNSRCMEAAVYNPPRTAKAQGHRDVRNIEGSNEIED